MVCLWLSDFACCCLTGPQPLEEGERALTMPCEYVIPSSHAASLPMCNRQRLHYWRLARREGVRSSRADEDAGNSLCQCVGDVWHGRPTHLPLVLCPTVERVQHPIDIQFLALAFQHERQAHIGHNSLRSPTNPSIGRHEAKEFIKMPAQLAKRRLYTSGEPEP